MNTKSSSIATMLLVAGPIAACAGTPSADPAPPGAAANVGAGSTTAQAKIRPALKGDPLGYTQRELMMGGYPLRPDPAQAPKSYEAWVAKVSKPAALITPILVPSKTRHTVMMSGSPNWSGYINHSGGTYAIVTGTWNVPQVPDYPDEDKSSSAWVGIDGVDNPGLWQAGTTQAARQGMAATYSAWFEFVGHPVTKTEIMSGTSISGEMVNFPVDPGDQVSAGVAILADDGTPTPFGSQLWYYVDNDTYGVTVGWVQATDVSSDAIQGAQFQGHYAEWIIERPCYPDPFSTNGCTPLPLAEYGQVHVTNMFDFVDNQWDSAPIHDDTIAQEMDNDNGEPLSTVSNDDSSSFVATFQQSK